MKMSAASIAFTDMEQRPTRHAGRGGVGAVMGAKGIKVIVIDDDGMKMRQPADPRKIQGRQQGLCRRGCANTRSPVKGCRPTAPMS
jgi:aldehyde:ferredoxin oxidoreductase